MPNQIAETAACVGNGGSVGPSDFYVLAGKLLIVRQSSPQAFALCWPSPDPRRFAGHLR